MRIVLTCNYSPWSAYSGGGQHSTDQIATALGGRGHRVSVVFTKPPWERIPVPDDLPYEIIWAAFFGLKSNRRVYTRPLNALSVMQAVKEIVRRNPGTVVHSQGEEGAAIPFLRKTGYDFSFVITPRFPRYPKALAEPESGRTRRFLSAVLEPKYHAMGMAVRGADRVCPTSNYSLKEVSRIFGIPSERCSVVHNGLDPVFFGVKRKPDAGNGPLVFFGRLAESKGTRELIQALALLGDSCPDVLIIGRGDDEGFIKSASRKHGLETRVRIKGWLSPDDLAGVLSEASIVVLPSHEESFGNAMAETLAAGAPLVSTTAGSIPEIVKSGEHGILVPPGDGKALASAIESLIADPEKAENMGRAGRKHAARSFSWDRTASGYEKIYRELAER